VAHDDRAAAYRAGDDDRSDGAAFDVPVADADVIRCDLGTGSRHRDLTGSPRPVVPPRPGRCTF